MPNKFRNKYLISSTRLQNWDYGRNAAYFVTICTKNRFHYFGNIVDGEMQLSAIGKMAQKYWMEIPQHFPFVQLNAFVVMPNHKHGIIIIDHDDIYGDTLETPDSGVSTTNTGVTNATNITATKKWKPGVLGVIINQYKRAVTINARKIDPNFAWQSRFHDHIIRNNESFERICNYIISNPENWGNDNFNNRNE